MKQQLTRQLRGDEGVKSHAYQDHLGFWTIGVGRLVDSRKPGSGLRPSEIDFLLQNDIDDRIEALTRRLPWFQNLDDARRGVLLNMSFQLGVDGLLGFKNTLAMVESGDYMGAARNMLQSLWARQTPERAARMADQMRTGVWHYAKGGVMDWLKTIAPMIGTALGGPLGGAAAAFLADKLGIESKTVEAVSEVLNSGRMTPDQISAIKLAEIDFQKFLKENEIKIEEMHAQDRDSARKMQTQTLSPVPAALSIGVTVGYFGVLLGMMTDTLTVSESPALLIMLGSLGTAWGMVMSFWFGTTKSSSQKDHIIAQAQKMTATGIVWLIAFVVLVWALYF